MKIAICSPAIGHLLDRYPPRRIILPAIILFSAGVASLGFLGTHIAQFYLPCLVGALLTLLLPQYETRPSSERILDMAVPFRGAD
jgi:MFS family permease